MTRCNYQSVNDPESEFDGWTIWAVIVNGIIQYSGEAETMVQAERDCRRYRRERGLA